jgi:hypothetical protein
MKKMIKKLVNSDKKENRGLKKITLKPALNEYLGIKFNNE